MTWLRIDFTEALIHTVHRSLAQPLILDMLERGHPIENYETRYGREHAERLGGNPATKHDWCIDIGGLWVNGQPCESVLVDRLPIQIASDHLGTVLRGLRKLELRRFADGTPYYKLRHWHFATVLTPAQHVSLVSQLTAIEKSAEERATAFFDERRARANAKAVN